MLGKNSKSASLTSFWFVVQATAPLSTHAWPIWLRPPTNLQPTFSGTNDSTQHHSETIIQLLASFRIILFMTGAHTAYTVMHSLMWFAWNRAASHCTFNWLKTSDDLKGFIYTYNDHIPTSNGCTVNIDDLRAASHQKYKVRIRIKITFKRFKQTPKFWVSSAKSCPSASDHLPFELLPWWRVSCGLASGLQLHSPVKAHTGVLAIRDTQVSYSEKKNGAST